jgi:A/G-specific adenine glycosylase
MSTDRKLILAWYRKNHRDLPWRKNRDPYRIWISETMLQQTTTTAVIPYYERFLNQFPTLQDLAAAPLPQVLGAWAGLGYYSRARNLHKAAQALAKMPTFPQTHTELLELPGFGPYTSRAVSSLAFSEAVGVLDGNVIRLLCRRYNLDTQWWRQQERQKLQTLVDELVAPGPSHELNQALMELGALICAPQNPQCIMCPWMKTCEARQKKTIDMRPRKKPRRSSEAWLWQPVLHFHQNKVLLIENDYAPFLRKHLIFPGTAKTLNARPKKFDFHHTITHHKIYTQLVVGKKKLQTKKRIGKSKWVPMDKLSQIAPASLIKKALAHAKK